MGHQRSSRPAELSIYGLCILVMMLAGCAVGPDYTPVTPDAPTQWHTELSGGLQAGAFEPHHLGGWWSGLQDETLNSLIDQALHDNLDLRSALSRVREARALRGIRRAGHFPTLDAGASAVKYRTSESTGLGREGELYVAAFDAGWELDLFGGVRRSVEAAQAALEATQESLRDVLVSLAAEVALNYVEVRTFQVRIAVAEKNVAIQEESYALNRSRYEAGMIGELAVQQSLYSLENTRALVPRLQTGLAAAKNRLTVLLGRKPGELAVALAEAAGDSHPAGRGGGGHSGRDPAPASRYPPRRAHPGRPDRADRGGNR
jgi:outer membrane protein TolC